MPKEEWGVKRLCPQCNTRFYDLNRDPMTCPECGHVSTVESLTTGRSRMMVSDKASPESQTTGSDDLTDDSDLDDETSDVDLGDDLLEEDDDDNVSLDEIADVASEDDES